jgi:hypothetical protein
MPCDGIAVLTAHTTADVKTHLEQPDSRAALAAWLNLPTPTWRQLPGAWTVRLPNGDQLQFRREQTRLVGREVDSELSQRAFALAQAYGMRVAQGDVVQTLAALGFPPQQLTQDQAGTISFMITAGLTINVKVYLTGAVELITQEGDFEGGQTVLAALLGALNAQGLNIQQTGQIETHHHDLQLHYLSDSSARMTVGQSITESGPAHTH